jgi:hypothetical protein
MTDLEKYEFDRCGYLVIPQLLSGDETVRLAAAVDPLIAHGEAHFNDPPRVMSRWGGEFHRNDELGYHVGGHWSKGLGDTIVVEDFFNAAPAFDCLVNHARSMAYVTALISDRPTINNSELRVRYTGNMTRSHMGGLVGRKYSYRFYNNRIDCMMIRFVYFVHDVTAEQGAFCVVPGTHKTNYPPPYECEPQDEPGVIALEVKAGDAILFTENLRHGGVPNLSDQVRKTLHVGYGPFWLKSQNIATMDEDPYIVDSTRERYDKAQRTLFHAHDLQRTRD